MIGFRKQESESRFVELLFRCVVGEGQYSRGMIAPGNHDIERFAALCGTLPHCFSTSMGEKQYRLREMLTKSARRGPILLREGQ